MSENSKFLDNVSFVVEEGKPQQIDFSKYENKVDLLFYLFSAQRKETGDKGPLSLYVSYKDVEDYENINSPIVDKKEKICEFAEGDDKEQELQYRFHHEHEATFSVEGHGAVIITGFFKLDVENEEEEEEEEAMLEEEEEKKEWQR